MTLLLHQWQQLSEKETHRIDELMKPARIVLLVFVAVTSIALYWFSAQSNYVPVELVKDVAPVVPEIDGQRHPTDAQRCVREKNSVASQLRSIEQCSLLGEAFLENLAAYVARHSCVHSDRVLMYSCESDRAGHFCGGMGDRFRGMITVFLLSMLSDRRFEIFHPTPVPIEELLEPHLYDFVPDETRRSREGASKIPVDQSLMKLQRHKHFLRKLDEADARGVSVLRVQSNSAGADHFIHRHPRWAKAKAALGLPTACNISCYFGCLHRVLFTPTVALMKIVQPSLPVGKFISVQVRMGGSWATGMHIPEPFRTPPAAVAHFLAILYELKSLARPQGLFPLGTGWMSNASLFVSSDAPKFIELVATRFNGSVKFIDGGFGHTDTLNLGEVKPQKYKKKNEDEIRENYSLTMANHFILSQGSHFVMAQSGFGDTAFWRSRCAASCLFVDMGNLKTGWQHHLHYGRGASSAVAERSRIIDLDRPPSAFY